MESLTFPTFLKIFCNKTVTGGGIVPNVEPARLEKAAADLLALVECAIAMRQAQKRYFKHRDAVNLERSKEVEREFDRRAALLMHNLTADPVLL